MTVNNLPQSKKISTILTNFCGQCPFIHVWVITATETFIQDDYSKPGTFIPGENCHGDNYILLAIIVLLKPVSAWVNHMSALPYLIDSNV